MVKVPIQQYVLEELRDSSTSGIVTPGKGWGHLYWSLSAQMDVNSVGMIRTLISAHLYSLLLETVDG